MKFAKIYVLQRVWLCYFHPSLPKYEAAASILMLPQCSLWMNILQIGSWISKWLELNCLSFESQVANLNLIKLVCFWISDLQFDSYQGWVILAHHMTSHDLRLENNIWQNTRIFWTFFSKLFSFPLLGSWAGRSWTFALMLRFQFGIVPKVVWMLSLCVFPLPHKFRHIWLPLCISYKKRCWYCRQNILITKILSSKVNCSFLYLIFLNSIPCVKIIILK